MVKVKRVSDIVMSVFLVFEEDVQRMICGHAPQSVRSFLKQSFYDELICEWDLHSAGELVMCLGELNGHI